MVYPAPIAMLPYEDDVLLTPDAFTLKPSRQNFSSVFDSNFLQVVGPVFQSKADSSVFLDSAVLAFSTGSSSPPRALSPSKSPASPERDAFSRDRWAGSAFFNSPTAVVLPDPSFAASGRPRSNSYPGENAAPVVSQDTSHISPPRKQRRKGKAKSETGSGAPQRRSPLSGPGEHRSVSAPRLHDGHANNMAVSYDSQLLELLNKAVHQNVAAPSTPLSKSAEVPRRSRSSDVAERHQHLDVMSAHLKGLLNVRA